MGSLLCFVLSFGSKQIAATLPAMVLIFDYIFLSDFRVKKVLERKYYHLSYWILLIIFISFFKMYFGELGQMGRTWSSYNYFVIQPYVVLNYLRLLFVPVGQCIDHFVKHPETIFEFRIMLSFLVLGGLFLFMLRSFKNGYESLLKKRLSTSSLKEKRDNSGGDGSLYKVALFSILWFFITLLPTSSFFPINEAMADRRLYLPGWGFSLLLPCAE